MKEFFNKAKKHLSGFIFFLILALGCFAIDRLLLSDILNLTYGQWFGILLISRTLFPPTGFLEKAISIQLPKKKSRLKTPNER
jgi:hypothetical protein